MNLDDPKLTAYALNELDSRESAEIEKAILTQPLAKAAIAETRDVAAMLSETLRAEAPIALCERRRYAVLRAASVVGKANTVLPRDVTAAAGEPWWNRVGVWQVIAACAVFGFGIYALSVSLGSNSPRNVAAASRNSEQIVQIGALHNEPDEPSQNALNVGTPAENSVRSTVTTVANLNAAKTAPHISPSVPNDISAKLQPPTVNIPAVGGTQPQIIAKGDDPLSKIRSMADIGKAPAKSADEHSVYIAKVKLPEQVVLPSDAGEVKLTGEEAGRYFSTREYLDARWREASSLHEGSSYAELAHTFRHERFAKGVHTFVMIRCPLIKLDVSFAPDPSGKSQWPVSENSLIKSISKPYFEPEQQN